PRRAEPGSAPGALPVTPGAAPPRITVIGYGPHEIAEFTVDDLQQLAAARGTWPVLWVNVEGVAHAETVRALGEIFRLHGLALEDVMEVPQRARAESYPDHLFVLTRMARLRPHLDLEQISLFVGSDFLLSFQERPGDPLGPVRERLRAGHPRIRAAGTDYLAYALLDAIVDNFFPVLEKYADRLDALEDRIVARPRRAEMAELHRVKRELMALRRAAYPMREALGELASVPTALVSPDTLVYLRDCHGHAVQVLDLVETYRDVSSSLTDLYLSMLSNRMNEIMKVLTVFASIFIPLGFITGVYGMNVDRSRWWWDLPFELGLIFAVFVAIVAFFWRRGWIGPDRD
ncbi:MAG TPA: magnesium/cobalt transporter CorA, partial [Longimicrobium sp.]|nr:magnesium/cobalt transporter CorA [Longimicrobium sp.]